MPLEPPPFQEADRCDVCKCSFSTFRRRHHCRCCGRTLCNDHSANQMALPKFGILTSVRVCSECFNDSSRTTNVAEQTSMDVANSVAEDVSRLDIDAEASMDAEASTGKHSMTPVLKCKCGMPLCICQATAPPKETVSTLPRPPVYAVPKSPIVKPKRADMAPKNTGSSSSSRQSSVFSHGKPNYEVEGESHFEYELNGEGAREAIKSGDTSAVKKLLDGGVDANYYDKQGMSLLHLAALFNRTDIAFLLIESGASFTCKNAQGETPIDCAAATLQYKMKQKIEEMNG